MTEKTIYIVYPERRFVSDEQITTWFTDAVANSHIGPMYYYAKTPHEMAAALCDAGLIQTAMPPDVAEAIDRQDANEGWHAVPWDVGGNPR